MEHTNEKLYETYYNKYSKALESEYQKLEQKNPDILEIELMSDFMYEVRMKRFSLYQKEDTGRFLKNSYLEDIVVAFYNAKYKKNKVYNFMLGKLPRYKQTHSTRYEKNDPNGEYTYFPDFMYTATDEEHIKIFAQYSVYSDMIKLLESDIQIEEKEDNKINIISNSSSQRDYPIEVLAWIFVIFGMDNAFKIFDNYSEVAELQAPITGVDSNSAKKDFAEYYQRTLLHYKDREYEKAFVRGTRKADQIKKLDLVIETLEKNAKILREVRKTITR